MILLNIIWCGWIHEPSDPRWVDYWRVMVQDGREQGWRNILPTEQLRLGRTT